MHTIAALHSQMHKNDNKYKTFNFGTPQKCQHIFQKALNQIEDIHHSYHFLKPEMAFIEK